MDALLIVLLILALLCFGVGFTLHVLWWVAVILVVVFLVRLAMHASSHR
jgi:hypothetical protein